MKVRYDTMGWTEKIKKNFKEAQAELDTKYNSGVESTKRHRVTTEIALLADNLMKRDEKELLSNKEDTFRKIRRVLVYGSIFVTPFFIGVPIKMIDDAIQRKVDLNNAAQYKKIYDREILWTQQAIIDERKLGHDVKKLQAYQKSLKTSKAKTDKYIEDLRKKEKDHDKEVKEAMYNFAIKTPVMEFVDLREQMFKTPEEYDNACYECFNKILDNTISTLRVPVKESITQTTQDAVRSGVHAVRNAVGGESPLAKVNRMIEPLDNIVNSTMNEFRNAAKSDKRDEIIEGDNYRIKLTRVITKCIAYGALGVFVHPAVAAIAFLGKMAYDSHVDAKERGKIINDMHQELAIVKEKIRDADAKGDHENKYKLMRIENKLDRTIARIKYDNDDNPNG